MTFDNLVTVLTIVSSLVALYFATRKQRHDENNLDADTIQKMLQNFKEQDALHKEFKAESEATYRKLRADFDAYKVSTNAQIADIASENVKLRRWVKRLMKQLEEADITPVRFEE